MKILLVEDEPGLRVILEDLFLADHDVRTFASGRRALEVLRAWQPDVLISDLGLPEVPGEELAQAAVRLPQPARVILMSAERERLNAARELAEAVLHKPFELHQLVRAVEWPLAGPPARAKENEEQ